MKKRFTHLQLLLGIVCIVVGLTFIILLSGAERYIGLVLLVLAIWLLISELYSKRSITDDNSFRSPTRDKILQHQKKR
jgi:hypothetical protein